MTRRLGLLLVAALVACGGRGTAPSAPGPASHADALTAFLDAVRRNDLIQVGRLWGSEKGPAAEWMDAGELNKRVTVIQIYLNSEVYRVVEGPKPIEGSSRRMAFHVELRRGDCVVVQQIDLVRTDAGGWIVQNVHLGETAVPPACQAGSGTPG